MIDLAERDRLLLFIIETDEEWVIKKGAYYAAKNNRTAVLAVEILSSKLKTKAMKEQQALASPAYKRLLVTIDDAYIAYALLDAKRKSVNKQLEIWQSELSALKVGMLLT